MTDIETIQRIAKKTQQLGASGSDFTVTVMGLYESSDDTYFLVQIGAAEPRKRGRFATAAGWTLTEALDELEKIVDRRLVAGRGST